jgi:hypothetical protein
MVGLVETALRAESMIGTCGMTSSSFLLAQDTVYAHTYKTKDGVAHLSFNVQWLVVLGVSDVAIVIE